MVVPVLVLVGRTALVVDFVRCRHCNKDSSRKVVHNLKNAKFHTEKKLQERKVWYGKCRQQRTSSLRQTRAIINKQEKDNLNRKRHSQAEGENQNKQKRQIEQRKQDAFPDSRERHTRFAKANGQIVHHRASESAPPVTVDSSKATSVEKKVNRNHGEDFTAACPVRTRWQRTGPTRRRTGHEPWPPRRRH